MFVDSWRREYREGEQIVHIGTRKPEWRTVRRQTFFILL